MTNAFYAYPWNFHDLDRDVARVKALGVSEITLAVSYHAGKFIHPGDPAARVYFPEDGTVYFRPRGAYGEGLRPQVSALTGRRDILAELSARDDIGVNAWVVLNHNTRLGTLRPDLCVQNAFGDRYPYSLCPAQPDVRDYAVHLCADLADNYPVRRLLLETPGYLTYSHGFHHEFAQVPPNPRLEALLGLCFCPACRKGARAVGIDTDGLAKGVVAAIDDDMARIGEGADESGLIALEPELDAFHQWRCQTVTALVAEIRRAVWPAVAVKVIATCQRPHATAYLEGHDLAALDSVSDGLELPLYQPSPERIIAEARTVLAQVPAARTSVVLRPGYPDMTSADDLGAAMAGLDELGLHDIAFYNLGMLPPVHLDWVRGVLTPKVNHV